MSRWSWYQLPFSDLQLVFSHFPLELSTFLEYGIPPSIYQHLLFYSSFRGQLKLYIFRTFIDLITSMMDQFPFLHLQHPLFFLTYVSGASLVAQWLRIRLPMQGAQVRALVQEYPTCCGATKPVHRNYWACALEPASHNYRAGMPQLLKPACLEPVLCNEKPPQWEARAQQRRPNTAKNLKIMFL